MNEYKHLTDADEVIIADFEARLWPQASALVNSKEALRFAHASRGVNMADGVPGDGTTFYDCFNASMTDANNLGIEYPTAGVYLIHVFAHLADTQEMADLVGRIKWRADSRVLARSAVNPLVLEAFVRLSEEATKVLALEDGACPVATLERAAKNVYEYNYSAAVARNPSAPVDLLLWLVTESHWRRDMARIVRDHCNATDKVKAECAARLAVPERTLECAILWHERIKRGEVQSQLG